MEENRFSLDTDDWPVVLSFLPSGWEEKAKEFKALLRCRGFASPKELLRVLFIHLAGGHSLRTTAAKAKEGEIASVSDVALLKRLKASGGWTLWMAQCVMNKWLQPYSGCILKDRNIRVIDATTVQEPGAKGTTWNIHYSMGLPSLRCDEVYVTDPKTGESFTLFTVSPGDLFMGDRAYFQRAGIAHVVKHGGDVLTRMRHRFPLLEESGEKFDLMGHLRTLEINQIGDWKVWFQQEGTLFGGRVCAVKKSVEAAEKARAAILKEARKKGRNVLPKTLEAAGYTFVFNTLDGDVNASDILEIYRGRWQVELTFKRLKSILGLGHLKKGDPEGAKAWLHGKLLVAVLIEAMVRAAETFFPWGYPIRGGVDKEMCLA